jgi:TM2 domain-containing membrane protein YozV
MTNIQHITHLQQELLGTLSGSELYTVHGLLAGMNPSQKEQFLLLYNENRKKPFITTLLAVFGGIWGIHRFYLGHTGMGITYFFTVGLFWIGWIRDMFRAGRMTAEVNQELALKLAGQIGLLSLHRSTDISPSPEHTALDIARKSKGVVNVSLLALESGLSLEQASTVLNDLSVRGVCSTEIAEDGRIEYHFRDFMPR